MKKFLTSLRCAYRGIRYAVATERNIRVHLLVFILALIAAFTLGISKIEFLLILGISAVNFSLELTNTSIEHLADKVCPEYNEQIRIVKDVMAGAVLVSSIFAIIIGFVIFSGPLLELFQR
ncbi:MAG TPA: diacylglycerol kinase family protein [Gallionellaceae bacterium]|nr:diacylglycerol kinase family protein [Gallionellaceae bacterium]